MMNLRPHHIDRVKAAWTAFTVYLTAQAAFVMLAVILLALSLAVVFRAIHVPSNREHVPPLPKTSVVTGKGAKHHGPGPSPLLFHEFQNLVGRGIATPAHHHVTTTGSAPTHTVTVPTTPPVVNHTTTVTTPAPTVTKTTTTTTTTPSAPVTVTTPSAGGLVSTVANGAGNVVTTTGNTVGGVVSTVTQNTPLAPVGQSLNQTLTNATNTLGGIIKKVG